MEWLEVSLKTKPEAIEIITGILMELGINSIMIEDTSDLESFLEENAKYWDYVEDELLNQNKEEAKVKFYIQATPLGQETYLNIKNSIEKAKNTDFGIDMGEMLLNFENVDDEGWLNNWKKHYKTFKLGEKVIINPVWETVSDPEGRVVFSIDPGHVFGTGLHQTTQLSIIELEKYVDETKNVLDIGCGTGILSIISLLLGAKEAYAVDIEPGSKEVVYKNAEINNINKDNYHVFTGDILEDKNLQETINGKFEIVVMNIVADVILSLLDYVSDKVSDTGIFISSGIIAERLEDVKNALTDKGFKIISTSEKDDWNVIVSKKI